MRYPDIMEQIFIKNIVFSKEIILEILNNSVEDAVRKIRAFVNAKVFKIDYEADPTHRNTTTVCLPIGHNKTKEDGDGTKEDKDKDKDTKKVNFE